MPSRAPTAIRVRGAWLAPWLIAGIVVGLLLIVAAPAWQARQERAPIVYRGLPFQVETPVVRAGEAVEFSGERCNRSRKPLAFVGTRSLIRADGPQFPIPASVNEAAPGCLPFTGASVTVPAGIAPGRYRLAGVISVPGKSGRQFTVGWSTEWFEVVP